MAGSSEPSQPAPEAPPKLRALALDGLGSIAWRQGDLVTATRALEESLQIWRASGERRSIGGTLSNLGTVMELRGDMDRAQALKRSRWPSLGKSVTLSASRWR